MSPLARDEPVVAGYVMVDGASLESERLLGGARVGSRCGYCEFAPDPARRHHRERLRRFVSTEQCRRSSIACARAFTDQRARYVAPREDVEGTRTASVRAVDRY